MDIVNETPLPAVFVVGKIRPPAFALTMIVKGTFDLRDGAAATPAEEMLLPTGDEPYDDDPEGTGSSRYASDFCPYKPRADLLLAGHCHAPNGRPVSRSRVRFAVGPHGRTLDVWGDREWRWRGPWRAATRPELFEQMELRYERAFGGRRWKRNPVGVGRRSEVDDTGRRSRRLPNVEDPSQPVRSVLSRPDPAGFGPLGAMWKERFAKVGTYRSKWRRQRWPWLPENFDPGHYNAAPEAMQAPFLRGDERIVLENLHPEHPTLESALPGLRVRSFVCDREPGGADSGFREVAMHLDTVWVDADALRLVLVWRGHTEVATPDHEDIAYAYVRSEALEEERPAPEACEALLLRSLGELAAEEEIEGPPPESEPGEDGRAAVESAAEKEMEALRESLLAVGIDPDEELEPTPEARAEEARLREELGIDPPEETVLDRDEIVRRAAAGESLAELDLSGLDLSDASLRGADLHRALLGGANLARADLGEANLESAQLGDAVLTGARLASARLDEADLTGADLTGADLTEASAAGTCFDRACLDGATLTALNATDASFSEASLTDANAGRGDFTGADLSETRVNGASFEDATLREASVEDAQGSGVRFDGADLFDLRAAGCDFSDASLRQASADGSVWEDAVLERTDLSHARLDGADLTGARLDDAKLYAASIKEGRFERATLVGTDASRSNLFEATFGESDLTRADLRGSNLFGADLLEARLDGARLRGANLRQARRER